MSTLKKNDLYIYELSPSVLDSLKLMVFDATLREVPTPLEEQGHVEAANPQLPIKSKPLSNSKQCNLCSLEFGEQNARREHFKTSFHTFNVKRSLKGLSPVNETKFISLIKQSNKNQENESDSDENLSDSDKEEQESESDEQGENVDDILEEALEKELQKVVLDKDESNNSSAVSHLANRSSQIYFKSQLLRESEVFGVYKSLFSSDTIKNPLANIRAWNNLEDQGTSISALFMMGGGHFAGAIVSHQRTNIHGNAKRQNQSLQEQAVTFIEHKTFHRYTTRRKQGGSQSAMDNAKGKANSAGSSLRRYNEAALRADIHNLLNEWKPYLAKCKNIFLRSRNPQDRKLFIDIIFQNKPDNRLKSFPFTTTRPSVGELKRSWCELTYLKAVSKPEPLPLNDPSAVKKTSSKKPQKFEEESQHNLSAEEKHTERLLSLLGKGRAPLIIAYLRNNKVDINFKLAPEMQHTAAPTMLHYASQQGLKQMVTILLTAMKADPCIKNKFDKTPWDLAKTPQTKQSFQIARHVLGESFANWKEAHVGEPLSREQVEEMNEQLEKQENEAAQHSIRKELNAAKERQKLEEEKQRIEKGGKLGHGRVLDSAAVIREQNLNSLSDDQRRRLMREQRARAAEARMNIKK